MKRFCWIGAILFLALTACHRPVETVCTPSLPELVSIDSLMQTRPDSALVLFQGSWRDIIRRRILGGTRRISTFHYAFSDLTPLKLLS